MRCGAAPPFFVQSSNIDIGFDAAQGAKCQINRMLLDRAAVDPNTVYRMATTAALLDSPQSMQALGNVTVAFRSAFDGVIDAIGEAIATATPVGMTINTSTGVRQSKGPPLNRSCRRTCLPGTGMLGKIAEEVRLEPWALQCVPCEPGTYSRGGVEAACVPCPPGFFQSERGQFGCISCDIGDFFQDREHQPSCLPCNEHAALFGRPRCREQDGLSMQTRLLSSQRRGRGAVREVSAGVCVQRPAGASASSGGRP